MQTATDPIMVRRWINQPSTLQPYYPWHGRRVLCASTRPDGFCRVFFVDGDERAAWICRTALSDGWPRLAA